MESDCLVSVVVPCRNPHLGFLDAAIDSVLAQTSARWRLLVVDDGSDRQDAVRQLAGLPARDPRIRVLPNRARYVTGAHNTAMRAATTPFVCSLHADDLLAPTAIEVVTAAIEAHPDVDYFHSSRRFIDEDGRSLSLVYEAIESFTPADFVRFSPVKALHCWRVEAGLAIGGMDEGLGLHGGDDWDFPWRLAEAGYCFRAVSECLYLTRDHREHERLTTHVPLDVQVAQVRATLAKHGVDEETIEAELADRDYLRQALFATAADRAEKEAAGFDPRTGWREPYDV